MMADYMLLVGELCQKNKNRDKMKQKILLIVLTLFGIGLTGLQAQTVKDIVGNVYKTVKIGTQVWMAENLKSTKFTDDKTIPLVSNKTWEELKTPAYCWYNNDEAANKNTYGALYNWYAVNTNKVCPTGWHLPTESEWTTLIEYLGGEDNAGGKLKEKGTIHWESPNAGATNEAGFTALPGGDRLGNEFENAGELVNWWAATKIGAKDALCVNIRYKFGNVSRYDYGRAVGYSVRCIKN
jgi:uncharacterized protein (TIGR02145 family)